MEVMMLDNDQRDLATQPGGLRNSRHAVLSREFSPDPQAVVRVYRESSAGPPSSLELEDFV